MSVTTCNCTPDTIDGYNINNLPAWELALRNAAHGHYAVKGTAVEKAVQAIDALRRKVGARRDRPRWRCEVTRPVRVYRLAVAHPEGSHDADGHPVTGWEPPGWAELADKYNRWADGDGWEPCPAAFRWPISRAFLSRSGAERRATMLRARAVEITARKVYPAEHPLALAEPGVRIRLHTLTREAAP